MSLQTPVLPNHMAVIPDGNRRWSKDHGLRPWEGHRNGMTQFLQTAKLVFKQGVKHLTFWALSIDNLQKRDATEIKFLCSYIKEELEKPETMKYFLDNGIRVNVVGKWKELLPDVALKQTLIGLEEKTKEGKRFELTVLFVYDGKTEMLEAVHKIAQHPAPAEEFTDTNLKSALWTGFLPEVDLVIRTGGEPHWSGGFMMWLTANSQFYFTPTRWPDFNESELQKAFVDYAQRGRRFGK